MEIVYKTVSPYGLEMLSSINEAIDEGGVDYIDMTEKEYKLFKEAVEYKNLANLLSDRIVYLNKDRLVGKYTNRVMYSGVIINIAVEEE